MELNFEYRMQNIEFRGKRRARRRPFLLFLATDLHLPSPAAMAGQAD
jgi:hypothetical protein